MLAVIDRPGVWLHAGMDGHITGLDLRQALAGLPRGLDVELFKRFVIVAERHFVAAWFKHVKTEN